MSRIWRLWVAKLFGSSRAARVLLLALLICLGPLEEALAATVPARPTSLVATLQTGPAVNLRWQDNSVDESRFEVERSVDKGTFIRIGTVDSIKGTGAKASYNDPTTQLGHVYAYRVRAVNLAGPSSYSNTELVSTVPPASPTDLRFVVGMPVPDASITVGWSDRSLDETSFEIQRSEDGSTFVRIGTTTGTTFEDTNLEIGPNYSYRVRALKTVLPSDFTNTVSLRATQIPAAPSELKVAQSEPFPTPLVGLSWKDNSYETGFQVEKSDNGGPFVLLGTTGPAETTLRDTSLEVDHTYTYRVRAIFDGIPSTFSGSTKWSNPLPPSNLSVGAYRHLFSGKMTVSLGWTDNAANETGYEVYTYTHSTGELTHRLDAVSGKGADTTASVDISPDLLDPGPLYVGLRARGHVEHSEWVYRYFDW